MHLKKLLHLLPSIILGLFIGRVLSEFLPFEIINPALNAIIWTVVAVSLALWVLRKFPFSQTWPALLLLLYVLYPEQNPSTAVLTSLLTILVWLQLLWGEISIKARWGTAIALLSAFTFFLLYITTLAPDILAADNGEFQLIAANLGVAHPPGFPLYTLIAHLMTRLPLSTTPAYQVNFLSAITSSITLFLIYLTTLHLTQKHLAAVTAVIALGSATTFWAQATTANIRSLTALFAAWMFYALISFYLATKQGQQAKADHYLIWFGLGLGLGGTHHASLAFMGLIFVIFILVTDPSLFYMPKRWLRPLLAFLLGLLPLFYLPLRAFADVRGTSVGLATWSGFWNHVLALGFRGDLFYYTAPAELWQRLKIMGNVMTFQFAWLLLLGMFIGIFVLLKRDWRLALLLGGAFGIHTLVTATYRAPQTVEYMLPAYVAIVLCLGVTVGWLQSLTNKRPIIKSIGLVLAGLLLVTAVAQANQNYPSYAVLHKDRSARDYAQPILEQAPPDSVILAHWHWVTPLWYLQEVEGLRPDVEIRFVFPEGETYAETWAQRVAVDFGNGRDVISTYYNPATFVNLPYPEPLDEAYLFRQTPRSNLPANFTPIDLHLGETILLRGMHLDTPTTTAGHEAVFTLAWEPLNTTPEPTTLFTHLVDQNGEIVAQQDVPALAKSTGVTLTQFRLTPRLDVLPGTYSLMSGAYTTEPLLNTNGAARTKLTTLPIIAKQQPQTTQQPTYRPLIAENRLLRGYDWDNTLAGQPRLYLHWQTPAGHQTERLDTNNFTFPTFAGPWNLPIDNRQLTIDNEQFYVPFGQGIVWTGKPLDSDQTLEPGQTLTLSQDLRSSQPILRDYAISVRLIGFEEDGYFWEWWDLDDSIPAMGAIPTLKWIQGSRVRSPHFLTVDPEAAAGQQIGGALNLYDAFTERPLSILDERITSQTPWLPLGTTNITTVP